MRATVILYSVTAGLPTLWQTVTKSPSRSQGGQGAGSSIFGTATRQSSHVYEPSRPYVQSTIGEKCRRTQHPRDEIDCLPNAEFVHHNIVHTDLRLLHLARTSRWGAFEAANWLQRRKPPHEKRSNAQLPLSVVH